MSQPVLYSYFRSSCSWRVRIALALKGIDYETKAVHLVNNGGEQHSDEYKKLNPLELVPTLCIDGVTLTDSMAIMEYLEETRPDPPLLPKDPATRAKIRGMCHVITSSTQPIQNLKVLQYVSNEENKLDKVSWGRKWITDGLRSFEAIISDTAGKYCVGDDITMADLCIIPQLHNAHRFGVDMTAFPTINRVAALCAEHPAFQAGDCFTQPDTPAELRKD